VYIASLHSPTAGQKKGGAAGLKFEAEATAHLQRSGVPLTDDSPKYSPDACATELLAILTSDGFVDSTEVGFVLQILLWVGNIVCKVVRKPERDGCATELLAILSSYGFVDSTEVGCRQLSPEQYKLVACLRQSAAGQQMNRAHGHRGAQLFSWLLRACWHGETRHACYVLSSSWQAVA